MLNEQQLNTSIKNFLERKSREYPATKRDKTKKRMVIQLDNSSLDISRDEVVRGKKGARVLMATASQMLRTTPGKLDKA